MAQVGVVHETVLRKPARPEPTRAHPSPPEPTRSVRIGPQHRDQPVASGSELSDSTRRVECLTLPGYVSRMLFAERMASFPISTPTFQMQPEKTST